MSHLTLLERRICELTSPDPEPRCPCPKCGDTRPQRAGPRLGPFGLLPRYNCQRCGLWYSRLTGTPLARINLDRDVFMGIVRRLTQPHAIRAAAADLGVGQVTLARIVRQLRAWLLVLDPTGGEEGKVQLGGQVLSPRERPPRPPEAIDPVLTRAIDSAVQALRSRRDTPVPGQCPHCASTRVRLHRRANTHALLPTYRCVTCRRDFTRLTGTPLARSRWPDKQRQFVRYLGVPMPLTEAADRLCVDYDTVRDWRDRYSTLTAQIDPSGALSDRIRISPARTGQPCGNCGRVDALAWEQSGCWHCAGCGRFLSKHRPLD